MDKRRILYIAAVTGVVAVLVAGGWLAYRQGWLTPRVPEGQVANPSIAGTLVGAEGDSFTVSLQDGSQRRFTLASQAKVISQVTTGEVGKTLAEFPPNSPVLVQTRSKYSSIVESVTLITAPRIDSTQAGPPVTWRGTVSAVAAGSIAVTTDAGQVSIRVPNDVVVVAYVLAGQPGRSLADVQQGTYVIINGYSVREGLVANTIQVINPLQ